MATKAYSQPEDLMVGAGTLYFRRFTKGDTTGMTGTLHHMGNVEEFVITTDVTTVDKNSSMSEARELMARVTTAVNPTGRLTMNEYDPTNLALGLYGTEGVMTQAAVSIAGDVYMCEPDSVIRMLAPSNQPYYNIQDIKLAPVGGSVPASFTAVKKMTGMGSQGEVTNSGVYTGTDTINYFLRVTALPTDESVKELAGLEISWAKSAAGPYNNKLTFSSTGMTETKLLDQGISIKVDITNVPLDQKGEPTDPDHYTSFVMGEIYDFTAVPELTEYTEGIDFVVEEIEARGGMIKIPATTRIPKGAVAVSCEVPAGTYPRIIGSNAGSIQGHLVFMGDPNIGGKYNIEGWKCEVTPEGDLTGLIGTDFGSFGLTIAFMSDKKNHPDAPFYVATKVG